MFINVCQSKAVPMPSSWSSGVLPDHVAQALERVGNMQELADQEFEALRLPMGCGDLREDTDKKGRICRRCPLLTPLPLNFSRAQITSSLVLLDFAL